MSLFFSPFLLLLVFAALLPGCASKTAEDPMEKWRELGERAWAHTPADQPLEPRFEIPARTTLLDDFQPSPAPPLPQQRVSLRMRDVPMPSLLLALAKAGGVNMMLSPGVRVMEGVNVSIDDVPWDVAFRSLASTHNLVYSWSGGVLQVRTLEDVKGDIEREKAAQEFSRMQVEALNAGPLVTSVIKLRYLNIGQEHTPGNDGQSSLSGTNLTSMITQLLSNDMEGGGRGVIVSHPETNSLVLRASRTDTEKVFALLEHLDRPRPQIRIQAHIVETTKDTARDLGFQWGGRRAGVAGGQPWMVSPGVGAPSGTPPTPQPIFNIGQGDAGMAGNFPANITEPLTGLSLGFIMGSANYLEVQLSALQREGKLNILSSPSITTMNNLMAFTENGEKVPYVSTDKDGNREVKFEDAVLRLEITPHVVDADHLRLDIKVKKDEVDLSRQVEGNPFIVKKETQTSLVVGNEETVVISGLTKELTSKRLEGVPWLKEIPGLGALFRRDMSSLSMEEVLIFITPTILPPPSHYSPPADDQSGKRPMPPLS